MKIDLQEASKIIPLLSVPRGTNKKINDFMRLIKNS